MSFEPIAIVGQSCVLPGALNPEKLWDNIAAGKDLLSKVPERYWRTDPSLVMAAAGPNAKDKSDLPLSLKDNDWKISFITKSTVGEDMFPYFLRTS